MLNVDTLVIDNEDRIGDSWRRCYHQFVLHDPALSVAGTSISLTESMFNDRIYFHH